MYSTLLYASREGERVRNPRCHGEHVFLEVRSNVTRVLRLSGGAFRERLLPNAHPTNSLIAVDGDELIYLTADSTLVLLSFEGGHLQPLRRLTPVPSSIAITAETVVWCSVTTADGPGEIWRWWRDTDRVERIGTHDSALPLLAVRPVPLPFPPERITTDLAIAADHQLGLIDVEGVDWISILDHPIRHLTCTEAAIVCTTHEAVIRCDLDSERCDRVFELPGPPRALVATDDDRVIVAHDLGQLEIADHTLAHPQANVYELDGEAVRSLALLDDPSWIRTRMALATARDGAILVEDGHGFDDVDRVVYLPYDWRTFDQDQSLQIQRWLADGRGAHLMIEGTEWWCGMSEGHLEREIFLAVNRWLRDTPPYDRPIPPAWRGWRITMGAAEWYCADGDVTSWQAIYIGRLIRLLAPHIPPLAFTARLDTLR